MNDDFPSVESLHICAKEEELQILKETLKLLLGQIAIKIALRADHRELIKKKNIYNNRYMFWSEERYQKNEVADMYESNPVSVILFWVYQFIFLSTI